MRLPISISGLSVRSKPWKQRLLYRARKGRKVEFFGQNIVERSIPATGNRMSPRGRVHGLSGSCMPGRHLQLLRSGARWKDLLELRRRFSEIVIRETGGKSGICYSSCINAPDVRLSFFLFPEPATSNSPECSIPPNPSTRFPKKIVPSLEPVLWHRVRRKQHPQ